LVLRAARDQTTVQIYGNDYNTPDGTCVRDYVHVADIADAHARALDFLVDKGESRAFNLANARGYSVKEVIAVAERICGGPISAEVAPRRPSDLPLLIGSAESARQTLGWAPRRSALDVQIADAWKWINRKAAMKAISAAPKIGTSG
jgi:UDP-glucose 4-epimerase